MIRWSDDRTEYEGAVLFEGERNYYDDSDFYAVIWTGEKLATVEYATTRFAGGGSATVDATEATKAAVLAWFLPRYREYLAQRSAAEARRIEPGRQVRVIRGRKVPLETVAFVGHVREGRWGQLCDLDAEDGRRWYSIQTRNLEVVDPARWEWPAAAIERLMAAATWETAVGYVRALESPAGISVVL